MDGPSHWDAAQRTARTAFRERPSSDGDGGGEPHRTSDQAFAHRMQGQLVATGQLLLAVSGRSPMTADRRMPNFSSGRPPRSLMSPRSSSATKMTPVGVPFGPQEQGQILTYEERQGQNWRRQGRLRIPLHQGGCPQTTPCWCLPTLWATPSPVLGAALSSSIPRKKQHLGSYQ